jgi:hypothetical protein
LKRITTRNQRKQTIETIESIIEGQGITEDPSLPLIVELEEVPWPARFNAVTMPQYDRESDPREFLLKYKAAKQMAEAQA